MSSANEMTAASESSSAVPDRKKRRPLQTTVIGSYPFPGWLEFASSHLDQFGEADIEEMRADAVIAAVHDQVKELCEFLAMHLRSDQELCVQPLIRQHDAGVTISSC